MGKTRRDEKDVMAGGLTNKKIKIVPKDPFAGKYGEMEVDVVNMYMVQVMELLFPQDEIRPFKYEISRYTSQYSGVAKSLWGETMFEEECRVSFVLVYERDKKDEMIEILNKKIPSCCYVIKKE